MEVGGAADRGADLLMECDEEEEEEGHDETVDKDTAPPPLRIVPVPVHAVNSSSLKLHQLVTLSGAPLGFRVNGQLLRLLPGGGGVELKLRSHPGGSASGFTSVLIPPTEPPPPPADHTPVITGVVSGEAAQKVLSSHSVNFQPGASPPRPASPWVTPSASRRVEPCHKLLHRGELGPVSPPDCLVCMSQYKLITELRGFMCLCSPVIAASLKHLKKKKKRKKNLRRWEGDQNKTARTNRTSRTSGPSAVCPLQSKVVLPAQRTLKPCDDFLSDRFSPPVSSVSPHQVQSEPLCGKLVIMVEDFYYGSAPGQSFVRGNVTGWKFTGPYHCIHCPTTLHNNITLMSHMQHHTSTMSQEDGHTCPHCFRSFLSPFKLQCHLEAVHSQCESTAVCKICELNFGSEPALLWHMKNTHKPGEMPYTCQVCGFRSSFFSDVWTHFERAHSDSKHLLCQYCLRVLHSNACYQQHFTRHQVTAHTYNTCTTHYTYNTCTTHCTYNTCTTHCTYNTCTAHYNICTAHCNICTAHCTYNTCTTHYNICTAHRTYNTCTAHYNICTTHYNTCTTHCTYNTCTAHCTYNTCTAHYNTCTAHCTYNICTAHCTYNTCTAHYNTCTTHCTYNICTAHYNTCTTHCTYNICTAHYNTCTTHCTYNTCTAHYKTCTTHCTYNTCTAHCTYNTCTAHYKTCTTHCTYNTCTTHYNTCTTHCTYNTCTTHCTYNTCTAC
ncbi:Pogo transposable element with ZNF domain [Larimichthys crocea]|nr:Pogo transposable element with ZNF domain [Larimichthys crocea]